MVENPPRKPSVPVWSWVAGGVTLLLCLCVGLGGAGFLLYQARQDAAKEPTPVSVLPQATGGSWQEQLVALDGVREYLSAGPLSQNHALGAVTYPQSPPVGGEHNQTWQTCSGIVYQEPVANERAVHSLEHGAVWITYRPDLAAADLQRLRDLVSGRDYLMLSPFPGQDAPISLQAWGYQLKVDRADDPRVFRFITLARMNAGPEIGAPCSGGTTETGPLPAPGVTA